MSLPLQFHGTCSDIYYTFAQKNSSTLNLLPFSLKIPPLRSNYVDLRSESLFFAQNSTSKPFLLLNIPIILHWKNFLSPFSNLSLVNVTVLFYNPFMQTIAPTCIYKFVSDL